MAALWYALLWLAAIPTQHTQAHARPLRAPAGYHMTAAGACRLGRLLACHRPRILWFCTITNTHQDFDTHHSSPRESLRAAPWRPPCRCYFKLGDHALLGAARGRLAAAARADARARPRHGAPAHAARRLPAGARDVRAPDDPDPTPRTLPVHPLSACVRRVCLPGLRWRWRRGTLPRQLQAHMYMRPAVARLY